MVLVATLAVDPAHTALDRTLLARVAEAVPVQATHTLSPGRAVDLVLSGAADADAAAAAIGAALGEAAVDVHVQEAAGRRRKLLISDMDSTLIGQECIDELAAAVGIKAEVAAITARAMAGEIAFEPALRERVALLAGVPVRAVEELLREVIRLTPGARTLVATMRAHGAHTALVSGGFTVFTGPVVAALGMHEGTANRLLEADGVFTGRVAEPILGRVAKRERLDALAAALAITRADVVAIGDGANDLDMIEAAGLGIAFRAKPAVAAAAGARIHHTDLTTALFFQGYPESAFARPATGEDDRILP